mgnify:CR=1 FL=1
MHGRSRVGVKSWNHIHVIIAAIIFFVLLRRRSISAWLNRWLSCILNLIWIILILVLLIQHIILLTISSVFNCFFWDTQFRPIFERHTSVFPMKERDLSICFVSVVDQHAILFSNTYNFRGLVPNHSIIYQINEFDPLLVSSVLILHLISLQFFQHRVLYFLKFVCIGRLDLHFWHSLSADIFEHSQLFKVLIDRFTFAEFLPQSLCYMLSLKSLISFDSDWWEIKSFFSVLFTFAFVSFLCPFIKCESCFDLRVPDIVHIIVFHDLLDVITLGVFFCHMLNELGHVHCQKRAIFDFAFHSMSFIVVKF